MMCETAYLRIVVLLIFFVKQKTAYEMRISDWRSDVCSSDLPAAQLRRLGQSRCAPADSPARRARSLPKLGLGGRGTAARLARDLPRPARPRRQRVVARRPLRHGRLRLWLRAARAHAGP